MWVGSTSPKQIQQDLKVSALVAKIFSLTQNI